MAAPFKFSVNLRNILGKTFIVSHIQHCSRCSTAAAAATAERHKWQLHSAVCVQRFPVITQDFTPLEQRYAELLRKREIRESLMSDHEIQAVKEQEAKKKAEKQAPSERPKHQEVSTVTTADLEREWEKELSEFQPASRITEADQNNDLRSRDRKLDRKLILLVKYGFDSEKNPLWRLPQVKREEGESMRQAAERALSLYCGDSMNAPVIGNAPSGYMDYKLPPGCADEYGVKLFFFKASYKQGEITSDKIKDYMWVTKEELPEYIPSSSNDAVQEFLLEY